MAFTLSITPSVLSLIALMPRIILVIAIFVLQTRPSALTSGGTVAWLGRVLGGGLNTIGYGETKQTCRSLIVL